MFSGLDSRDMSRQIPLGSFDELGQVLYEIDFKGVYLNERILSPFPKGIVWEADARVDLRASSWTRETSAEYSPSFHCLATFVYDLILPRVFQRITSGDYFDLAELVVKQLTVD
jgi:hypothetical protein